MRELSVGEEPYIRAYTEYAFVDMIMNNPETTGNLMVSGRFCNNSHTFWKCNNNDAIIHQEGDKFSLEEDYLARPTVKHLFRRLERNDVLEIQIDYQQYTNLWDSVGLFIDTNPIDFEDYFNNKIVLGNYCGSIFMTIIDGIQKLILLPYETKKYPVWLKIKVNQNMVMLYYATDKDNWILANSIDYFFEWDKFEYKIGVYFSMSDRQYYKWIFNNFINLRLDLTDSSTLNYCGFVKRDCKNYTINPIVRISTEKLDVISEYGITLWKYIVANINKDKYLEFWLNEKYIPGLRAYQLYNYTHENLVYGYDEVGELLILKSIFDGKPISITVSFKDFQDALKNADQRLASRFYLFERQASNAPYLIDVSGIKRQLTEYCMGINPTLHYKNLITEEEGVFGLECYRVLLEELDGINKFLGDVRISYVLYEHKKCMRDRIEYMIRYGYLQLRDDEDIQRIAKENVDLALLLMKFVIKYQATSKEKLKNRIFELLTEIKENELLCYQKVIDLL